MLEVEYRNKVAVIDLRERINRGEHPKREVLEFVQEAQLGTVIELHVPHPAKPLVLGLESIGVPAIMNELGPAHYRIMCVKM